LVKTLFNRHRQAVSYHISKI